MEWMVEEGCVKIVTITHDQLLEGKPEKICIFYICVCVFICIMNMSSVYIEKEEKQPPSSGSWSAAHR